MSGNIGCLGTTVLAVFGLVIYGALTDNESDQRPAAPHVFDWNDALYMCQYTIKQIALDPEKAEVPYVENQGRGDEYFYVWDRTTRLARLRNKLGMELATQAWCKVNGKTRSLTYLRVDDTVYLDDQKAVTTSAKPKAQQATAKTKAEAAQVKAKPAEVLIPRSIPGDKGKYFLLEKEKTGNIIRVLHKRIGVDSVGYTLTETNCKTMQMRELGYSEESPSAIKEEPTKWFELVPGSSKSDLANFVCK